MSPSTVSTSVSVTTCQCSVYLPGGKVGARANRTSGAESRRGWSASTISTPRLIRRAERTWSTGRSKRTEKALVRPSIVALVAGAASCTWTPCAREPAGRISNPTKAGPKITHRRKVMVGAAFRTALHAPLRALGRRRGRLGRSVDAIARLYWRRLCRFGVGPILICRRHGCRCVALHHLTGIAWAASAFLLDINVLHQSLPPTHACSRGRHTFHFRPCGYSFP